MVIKLQTLCFCSLMFPRQCFHYALAILPGREFHNAKHVIILCVLTEMKIIESSRYISAQCDEAPGSEQKSSSLVLVLRDSLLTRRTEVTTGQCFHKISYLTPPSTSNAVCGVKLPLQRDGARTQIFC